MASCEVTAPHAAPSDGRGGCATRASALRSLHRGAFRHLLRARHQRREADGTPARMVSGPDDELRATTPGGGHSRLERRPHPEPPRATAGKPHDPGKELELLSRQARTRAHRDLRARLLTRRSTARRRPRSRASLRRFLRRLEATMTPTRPRAPTRRGCLRSPRRGAKRTYSRTARGALSATLCPTHLGSGAARFCQPSRSHFPAETAARYPEPGVDPFSSILPVLVVRPNPFLGCWRAFMLCHVALRCSWLEIQVSLPSALDVMVQD